MIIRSKLLEMTKITLSDFSLLYDALSVKKAALPVKLLRRFKDVVTPMQYDYVENYYLRYGVQSNFDSYEYNSIQ